MKLAEILSILSFHCAERRWDQQPTSTVFLSDPKPRKVTEIMGQVKLLL